MHCWFLSVLPDLVHQLLPARLRVRRRQRQIPGNGGWQSQEAGRRSGGKATQQRVEALPAERHCAAKRHREKSRIIAEIKDQWPGDQRSKKSNDQFTSVNQTFLLL